MICADLCMLCTQSIVCICMQHLCLCTTTDLRRSHISRSSEVPVWQACLLSTEYAILDRRRPKKCWIWNEGWP